jgi:hypothetical protein
VLQLFVVTTSEDPLNRLTNPNPRLSHYDTWHYCCLYIRSCFIFTEPFPSNNRGHINRLIWAIYELHRSHGLSNSVTRRVYVYTDTQTAWWSHKPTPIFLFQNKDNSLKINKIKIDLHVDQRPTSPAVLVILTRVMDCTCSRPRWFVQRCSNITVLAFAIWRGASHTDKHVTLFTPLSIRL